MKVAGVVCIVLCLSCGSGPDPVSPPQQAGPALFEDAAAAVGLDFQHFAGVTDQHYLPEIMGAGVALLDYDADGDLDIYFLQGAALGPPDQATLFPPPGRAPGNRLFRNNLVPSGKLRFEDVTDTAGVGDSGYGMGAAVGDYDNDGYPDLFVTNFGPNVLYHNQGDGSFVPATAEGMDDARWSTSASFVDYDADGDLDLFFANYVDFSVANNKECFDPTGAPDYCTPNVFNPAPDRLFRNDRADGWTDVSRQAGLDAAFGNGLGVVASDFDADGRLDLYVANDGMANQLWMNRGDGRFEDVAMTSGAAYSGDGRPEASMGVAAADFDFDGDEDLLMTHLARETHTLYINNGLAGFRDVTNRFGLGSSTRSATGFGMLWADFDLDGRLDLFVANGAVTIVESLRGAPYPFQQPNQLFRGGEARYEDVTEQAGPALALSEVSRGAAGGDIDGDGDIDIVLANNSGPARLLLNRAADGKAYVRVRLRGTQSNRDGVGARVALLPAQGPPRWSRVAADGSYLSASEPAVVFALPDGEALEAVGVVWPNGRRERFSAVTPNSTHTLTEGEGQSWPDDPTNQ